MGERLTISESPFAELRLSIAKLALTAFAGLVTFVFVLIGLVQTRLLS